MSGSETTGAGEGAPADQALPEHGADGTDSEGWLYDAFISYRHREPDRRWAKWLHSQLETYRVPRNLVRQLGVPRRVNRVFRDEEELPASSSLSREIEQALWRSRYLIVICSSQTPESQWVEAEIAQFRKWERHDRILALLVEGEPAEAFPRPLVEIRRTVPGADGEPVERVEEVEPLAADVRPNRIESSRQLARLAQLRLLACLVGCRFDDLRRRDLLRQRRRVTAVVTTLTVLLLLVSTLAGWALYQHHRAEEARRYAEQQRDVAVETLNTLVYEAYEKLEDRPGTRQLRDSMLETALSKLSEVGSSLASDSSEADAGTAAALRKRADLFMLAGRTDDAAELLEESLSVLQPSEGAAPSNEPARRELAAARHTMGRLEARRGRKTEARDQYQRALSARQELLAENPQDHSLRAALAGSHEYLADTERALGNSESALEHYRRSKELRQRVAEAEGDTESRRDLATAYSKLGDINRARGERETAREHYRRFTEIARQLAEANPYNTRLKRQLAVAQNKLGGVAQSAGDSEAAKRHYEASAELMRELAESDRGNLQWRRELAVCLSNLGHLSEKLGELDEARRYYRQALSSHNDLVEADPENAQYRRDLSDAYQLLGDARMEAGAIGSALSPYRQARAIREKLLEQTPDSAELKRGLAIAHDKLGDAYRRLKDPDKAGEHYQRSLALRRALAEEDAGNVDLRRDLSLCHMRLAAIGSEGEEVRDHYEKALEIRRSLVSSHPENHKLKAELARTHHAMGAVYLRSGKAEEALRQYKEAVDLRKRVLEASANLAARINLAQARVTLGDACRAAERLEEAVKHYQEASRVMTGGSDDEEELPHKAARQQIRTLTKLGDTRATQDRPEAAREAYQRALSLVERLKEAEALGEQSGQWISRLQSAIRAHQ